MSLTKSSSLIQDDNQFLNSIKRKVSSGINRHEEILQRKLETLQLQLLQTKQNIVRNVIQTRAIEQSKVNVSEVQRSLYNHVIDKNDPTFVSNTRRRANATKHNFTLDFDTEILMKMNHCLNLPYAGILKELLRALSEYSDTEFQSLLAAFPLSSYSEINVSLYGNIVKLAAREMVSPSEVERMYDRSIQQLNASNTQDPTKRLEKHWAILKNILCKKLRLLYLLKSATQFIKSSENSLKYRPHFTFDDTLSSTASTTKGTQAHKSIDSNSLIRNASNGLSPIKSVSSSVPNFSQTMPSHSTTTNTTTNNTMSKAKHNKRNQIHATKQLEEELNSSLQKKEFLKHQIVHNLLDLCATTKPSDLFSNSLSPGGGQSTTTMSIPDTNTTMKGSRGMQPTHIVRQYFHQIAIQKFTHIFLTIAKKLLQRAWYRWKESIQQTQLEISCSTFCRIVGTYRFVRYSYYVTIQEIVTAFQRWIEFNQECRIHEQESSSITIQRYYRGFLARMQQKRLEKEQAAQAMQQVIRVFIARRMVKRMIQKKKQKKAVLKIEMFYKKNKLRLVLRKLRKQKLQLDSIQRIQTCYRNYRLAKRILLLKTWYYYHKGAKKLQCLFRRYRAVLRFEAKKLAHRRKQGAIAMQTIVRGKLQRIRYYILLYRHHRALQIQYAWRISKAKTRKHHLLVMRSIKRIQCAMRRKLAYMKYRRRYDAHQAYLQQRRDAIRLLTPYLLSYYVRWKHRPLLLKYKRYRNTRALQLQRYWKAIRAGYHARQYVKTKRDAILLFKKRNIASKVIQKYIRSKILIKSILRQAKYEKIQRDRAAYLRERNKVPYYYRLQQQYFTDQYIYHKKAILILQCFLRVQRAKQRVRRMKIAKQEAIQQAMEEAVRLEELRILNEEEVALQAEELREIEAARKSEGQQQLLFACIRIQSVVRLFIVQRKVRRTQSIETIKWFLVEQIVSHKARKAIEAFRLLKAEKIRKSNATKQIQAIVRGRQQRRRYKKSYRTLVKQRELRIRAKRLKAAIILQCIYRIHLARKKIIKQRAIVTEQRQEQAELSLLEASLAGYHQSWMEELLAIRAQTGIRGMIARKEFGKKIEAHKIEQENKRKALRNVSATQIQAMVRGKLNRIRHKKNLPQLKKSRRQRCFCIQCESQLATKRCRQCKDKFCESCYDFIHQKGNRKKHTFEIIRIDAKIMAIAYDQPSNGTGNSNTNKRNSVADVKEKKRAINPKEWEEFYDESAKAKYWFNKLTGEASWINPMTMK